MNLQLRTEDLQWTQIDDEIVALHGSDARYLAVDGSAVLLWPALVSGTTREELVNTLVEAYGIDEQRAGADIDAFLAELSEQRLLAT